MLASQRIESVVGNWFSSEKTNESTYDSELPVKRGATPSAIEWMILAWVKSAFYFHIYGCCLVFVVKWKFTLNNCHISYYFCICRWAVSLLFMWFHIPCRIFSCFHLGLIWSEVKQLWDIGLQEYVNDMWNVIDFVTNSLYVATVALRVVSYFQVI